MITLDNLEAVLTALHYVKSERKHVFVKEYLSHDCVIKVDFEKKQITYPEDKGMKIHRKTTCKFSENENFVVLECITSLLDKGYKPQHIELEKPMPGGHNDTGGYCDIQIKDNDDRTFLLIECKKEDEFDKFWNKTMVDGGQLFRYYNSYRSAHALCMYTSDLSEEGKIKRISNIISMKDNEELLSTDSSLRSFKQVQLDNGDKEDYFRVWKETYKQDFVTRGIFEEDIDAYTVGKQKYTIKDLAEVDNATIQKKYHEFATILRQHNVGSHENAFDKLVNLFLAKIVDETLNSKELQFYWKGAAYDDFYSLQDRLQKLYKEGMEKFLGEEVTYIDQKEVAEAFHLFKNDPDATKNKVLDYFRQLKFYTNSDFAFLDVHNEQLFFQNAEILKKIVVMLEDIKLKTEEQNQFLGDLFEGFLDDGVKQSEGQFFTPLPIVKFLVSALPLENIIKNSQEIPKAIDYACGAGHFLTEYASCIKEFVNKYKTIPVSDYYKEIYGIEKEYRLSKVSKVSAFMYGQPDIKIIYGDALAYNKDVEDGRYSVLIANPPYSVKGFLEMLSDQERSKYTLTESVSDISKNKNIETFFVERAKQLLKGNAVAAIVLPSSVLSVGNIYVPCREILLKYFEIVAITVLGSGTFGKTGTETSTLFLRRRCDNPDIVEHYVNRVNAWFEDDYSKDVVFDDGKFIDDYCEHCNFDVVEYRAWIHGGECPQGEVFELYLKKVLSTPKYKAIAKKKITCRYSEADKEKELDSYVNQYIKDIEKEKLYYYILAKNNNCRVVVINSPSDKNKKLIKSFLGYEWSDSKGNEGIKYLGMSSGGEDDDAITINKGINSIQTPLFDPNNFDNQNKLNYVIRANFESGEGDIPEELEPYAESYELEDMLDFSRVDFDKSIRTSGIIINETILESKYDLKPLHKLAKISRGASPRPIENYLTESDDGVNWIKIGDVAVGDKYITRTAQKITLEGARKSKFVHPGDFIISNSMSVGRPYIVNVDGCIHDGWLLMSDISSEIDKEYFYYVLSSNIAQNQLLGNARGGVVKNLNIGRVSTVKIPVPPKDIQKNLVKECNLIEEKIHKLLVINYELKRDIEFKLQELYDNAEYFYRLDDDTCFELSIGRRVLNREVDEEFDIPVYSANVFEPFGYIDRDLLGDFSKNSVVWGIDGDWQVNVFEKGYKFYPTDHCGVLRLKTDKLMPRYVGFALLKEGEKRGFKRSYRASIDRIGSIVIKAPDVTLQEGAENIISEINLKIKDNQEKLIRLEEEKRKLIEETLI